MNDLKPCPFCGAAADLLPEGQVECSNEDCLVHVMSASANDWNHRASGWIACSERRPECGVDVLCYSAVHPPFVAQWNLAECWISVGFGIRTRSAVTHWQPLPEPPK